MKKTYVAPDMEIIHIKQGNVVMNSHDFSCIVEGEACDEWCHECLGYVEPDT